MIYEILGFYDFELHFFFQKTCLKSQHVLTIVISWGKHTFHAPPRGFCVVNGPPTRVPETSDIAHPILCLCIFFWKKWPMAVRSMYGSYMLLAEKHRCECSDVRESVHGRPTPEADTPIQPL